MARGLSQIVEQHAEEAAFLWVLRGQATRAPNCDLDGLAQLDERIDAHLDGVRVAGACGWEACREQLDWREVGEVFAAAHVALKSRIGRRLDIVLDVATESVELGRGVVGALAWLPYVEVEQTIESFLVSGNTALRRIGLAASAVHRRDPGSALAGAAIDSDCALRVRALKAAAELGRRDLLPLCTDAAPDSPFWNGWSTAVLGDARGAETLRNVALGNGPFAAAACDLAVRRMPHDDALAWHRDLTGHYGNVRLGVVLARALGDPALLAWLIDVMHDGTLARAAGEAFTFITGIALSRAGLSRARPEGFESGPTDDPNDDDVAIDLDEHLLWPEPRAVEQWWLANQGRFVRGRRYFMGRPITADSLHEILFRGAQRQRMAAALELVLRRPGQPLFEVRARADNQLRSLSVRSELLSA
jgi:uncharacterized protein (TIGR02270 family)